MEKSLCKRDGQLVISLDFELMWGALDLWTPDGYGKSNIMGVRNAIDRMLKLFDKYDVHATFASVGFLMYEGKEELQCDFPDLKPLYTNEKLSPYVGTYINDIKNSDSRLYFAKDVILKLKGLANIEIGSHTFCHYFCWEEGQNISQFKADMVKSVNRAKFLGVELNSIVFPRDQVPEEYLDVCRDCGISAYRGIYQPYYKKPKNNFERILQRVVRLVDTYIPIMGSSSIPIEKIVHTSITNVPASRFLRPYNKKLRLFERMKINRIKGEIKYAAKNGELYHLWWHPHNMGANIEDNINQLENILEYYKTCSQKYGMKSYTMGEWSKQFNYTL